MTVEVCVEFRSMSSIELTEVYGLFVNEANNKKAGTLIATLPDKVPFYLNPVKHSGEDKVTLHFELSRALTETELDEYINAMKKAIEGRLTVSRVKDSAKLLITVKKTKNQKKGCPIYTESRTGEVTI